MNTVSDFSGVLAALNDYFDGLYESDVDRLARVFHPKANYYCATGGQLLHLDMVQYFPVIEKRPSPKSQGHTRTDRILSMEFAGPVTVFAKVECSIPGKSFIDFLINV